MQSVPIAEHQLNPEIPGMFTDPGYFDALSRLRAESPVHAYAPNSWMVTRYDDVRQMSRDPGRYCSGRGVLMNDPVRQGMELPGSILHMDPPEHAAWRALASRWFTPRAMGRLEDRVRVITAGLLDAVDHGAIDLVEALAAPLPVLVIAELLGVDDRHHADFVRWSDGVIDGADAQDASAIEAVGEFLMFLNAEVLRRRGEPSDDLLSTRVASEVGGRGLADDEIVMYCLSLLVAGNETSRHLISGGLAALHDHPDQRAALAADPELLGGAVEECLRWVTPIQAFARTATTDVNLGGHDLPAGAWLVMMYASANRDTAAFGPTAGRFDITRAVNQTHLAFGFGEHLCLGAALARLEARVFFGEFLARYPDFTLVGEPTWTSSTLVRGYRTLPAVLPAPSG